jgi:bla regulator protein blaR1
MADFIRRFAAISMLFVGVIMAQSAVKRLKFEIASVKPADPGVRVSNVLFDAGEDLTIVNVPLRKTVTYAYQIRDFQLTGAPSWIGAERYDISARTARGDAAAAPADPNSIADNERRTRADRVRERLRSLLADRFGLVVHHETKEQTILVLTLAKNGPKLKVVSAPGDRQGISVNDGRLQGFATPITLLATQLSIATGQVVEDRTALAGKYDFVLTWTPDIESLGSDHDDQSLGPTIFTALKEQLGLRLDPAKGQVDVLAVDHIERPSAN